MFRMLFTHLNCMSMSLCSACGGIFIPTSHLTVCFFSLKVVSVAAGEEVGLAAEDLAVGGAEEEEEGSGEGVEVEEDEDSEVRCVCTLLSVVRVYVCVLRCLENSTHLVQVIMLRLDHLI